MSEGAAIMQLGNFDSCQQQHSTHFGVLRVAILATGRRKDIAEKASGGPGKCFGRKGVEIMV